MADAAERHYFKTDEGSTKLSANGTYFAKKLPAEYRDSICVICGYNESDDVVAVTAGLAEFAFSPIDGQYHDQDNFIVDLTLAGANAGYEMPNIVGPVIGAKVTISGVDFSGEDISYFKSYIWRG